MTLVILDDCINCDMCGPECPNAAISLQTVASGKRIYQIDPALCTECAGFYPEPTCIRVCPIDVVVRIQPLDGAGHDEQTGQKTAPQSALKSNR